MSHQKFKYENLGQVIADAQSLGLDLNFSENLDILARKVDIGGFVLPNTLVLHPMEGGDGEFNGTPSELTKRRYERFSKSGAGLIWFEATAVTPKGRANPRQLWIYEENLDEYKRLCEEMLKNALPNRPMIIMQITHSGRYSKPTPIPATRNPYLDKTESPLVTDDELDRLTDDYVRTAILAKAAGFDGVDVKACHGYLNCELLSAFTREGKYGGAFENRTRFLLTVMQKIRDRLGKDFIVTTRMNIHDALPYPYGWGADDLSEPKRLIKLLQDNGVKLVNLTMGNPYYNPHVNRPYDNGPYTPDEHPLIGVARLINGIGEIQTAFPDIAVISTGFTWLRHFSANLAAGTVNAGKAPLIGYGRECFAYPEFPKDILNGGMKKEKCCITCGKCTELMRAGIGAGCVIRDTEVYAPLYGKYCESRSD